MIEEILIDNGFTKKDAKIYLCILQFGEITFARIANQTHLKRTTVYSSMEELKKRGIVSVNKRGGIQYASALSPRILVDRFKKSADMAENILPQLLDMAYSSPLKPRIQFFEGLAGIQEILKEFSYSKTQSMGFTDYQKMPKELLEFIRKEIIPERRRNKNLATFIVPDNSINRKIQQADQQQFTQHRIVNFPLPENPIELLLFNTSHIAFLSYEKQELFGLIIDSVSIYKTLKNIFLLIWGNN